MKRVAIISAIFILSAYSLIGCKSKSQETVDLSGIHTSSEESTATANETLASATTPAASEADVPETTGQSTSASNVSANIDTYTDGNISIQYPVVSNMSDPEKQSSANELLKNNATSITRMLDSMDPNAKLSIKCKVSSINRNRITAVYTGAFTPAGAAAPVQVFYTNTVDLKDVKSLGLNDYTDGYTMAGYVMSEDCKFYNVSSALEQELLDYRAGQSIEYFTKLFNEADFPLTGDEETAGFPASFSYTYEGVLYFSIPVPHTLGDYAIVEYNLGGK